MYQCIHGFWIWKNHQSWRQTDDLKNDQRNDRHGWRRWTTTLPPWAMAPTWTRWSEYHCQLPKCLHCGDWDGCCCCTHRIDDDWDWRVRTTPIAALVLPLASSTEKCLSFGGATARRDIRSCLFCCHYYFDNSSRMRPTFPDFPTFSFWIWNLICPAIEIVVVHHSWFLPQNPSESGVVVSFWRTVNQETRVEMKKYFQPK